MAITRWEPYDELAQMSEFMNRFLEGATPLGRLEFLSTARAFPVDVFEADDEYHIEASLPGIDPKDLHVTATGTTITVRAQRHQTTKERKVGNYLRQERSFGEMMRVFTLPGDIDREHITSVYEHGVLTVRVPKSVTAKPKQIPVQVKEPVKELAGAR